MSGIQIVTVPTAALCRLIGFYIDFNDLISLMHNYGIFKTKDLGIVAISCILILFLNKYSMF